MLPRAYSLKRQEDFKKVFKDGRKQKTAHFLVQTLPNELKHSRIGIVVSKKVAVTAIRRNEIRRRVIEALDPTVRSWEDAPARDIVILVMKSPEDLSVEALAKELLSCL